MNLLHSRPPQAFMSFLRGVTTREEFGGGGGDKGGTEGEEGEASGGGREGDGPAGRGEERGAAWPRESRSRNRSLVGLVLKASRCLGQNSGRRRPSARGVAG